MFKAKISTITVLLVRCLLVIAMSGCHAKGGLNAKVEGAASWNDFMFKRAVHRGQTSLYVEGEVQHSSHNRRPGETPMVGYLLCYFNNGKPDEEGCMSDVVVLSGRGGVRNQTPSWDLPVVSGRRFLMDVWVLRRVKAQILSAECESMVPGREDPESPCVTRYVHVDRFRMEVKFSDDADPDAPGKFVLGKVDRKYIVF